jgi:hypothetical protein
MTDKLRRRSILKLAVIAVLASVFTAISLLGYRQQVLASAYGPSPSFTGAVGESNCTACHTDFEADSGKGSIELTGIPANYAPGQEFNVTVTVRQADAVIYGFQFTAIDPAGRKVGSYTIPPEGEDRLQVLQGVVGENNLLREYMEHTSGGLTNGQFGFNSWTFKWTAPAQTAGKIDFYAAGNAANSDGRPAGDYIYTTSASTIPASSATFSVGGRVVSPGGQALRNTRVILTPPNGGQQIATTSSFGNYNFPNLPSGVQYTITVVSRRYRFAPRVFTLTENQTDADFIGLE